jgi:IS5 family transposase
MTNKRGARHKPLDDEDHSKSRIKSKVRSKVEYPFLITKSIFGFHHVRYRELMKNNMRFEVVYALTNLYMKRHNLMG